MSQACNVCPLAWISLGVNGALIVAIVAVYVGWKRGGDS